ncbi:MAG TPA: gliding motility-associated C-terminal domain-containing protein [Bacteroidales bacterium]|nr:gliding motility-associated C-terminal domain-containing protein [Bacteroidales bacterium]
MRSFFSFILTFSILFLFSLTGKSQSASNWSISWSYPKVFLENKGQFDNRDKLSGSQILYGIDHTYFQVYFTKQGLTYHLNTKIRNPERKKGDTTKPKKLTVSDFVRISWLGANPNPEIVAEEMMPDYQTYSMLGKDRKSYYDIRNIKGFKKITYKNLYPGIDVAYTFHPESGIKYTLILHPGADISVVKMKYASDRKMFIDENGNLKIATLYGDIIDHAPLTFYEKNGKPVKSHFQLYDNNEVGFILGNYDPSQKIIVDPWVQTPSLPNSNCVWELDKDAAGNIYVIGGDMPMKLQKYNASGVLQWTYSTPWDTTNSWLGTLATDLNGNSYVTSGSTAAIQKVNSAGSMVWSATGGAMDEYWMISFNCDQTKLIVGGTRLDPIVIPNSHGVIFDINTTTGSVISLVNVATTRTNTVMGMPITEPNEVRALSSSRDAKYYFLTLDSVGSINQNMSLCSSNGPVFKHISDYNFAYKSENYRPNNGNAGIRAIRANNNFVYTQNGNTIHKRSLVDGSIITSAAIPGGISTLVSPLMNFYQPGNNGIAVDSCGNVYVGSGDRVIKYDANLNILSQTNLPFAVYDVVVTPGGNVVVCGGTGTSSSSSRTGYIQSINMSACHPFALICCNTSICPAGPFCQTDAAVTLVTETSGGSWSGPGVDPVTGVFDPSAAGPGTHTITYTLPCGSSSINITVNNCMALYVCQEPNGDLSVSGGFAPYTWQTGSDSLDCSSCYMGVCMPPICNGVIITVWTAFATGNTVTPPVGDTMRVIDNNGNFYIIYDTASLPACSACPHFTFNMTNVVNVCPGQTNGGFTVTTSGGAAPYSLDLKNSSGAVIASFSNVSGAQTFTGLAAGVYNLVATDNDTCRDSTYVTINQPTEMTIMLTPQDEHCPNSCDGAVSSFVTGGDGPYSYAWNPPQDTLPSLTDLCAGTYSLTVTDGNSCTKTASTTVETSVTVSADFTANPQSGNVPLIVSFTYTGSGAVAWFWDFGDGDVSSDQNPGHVYDTIGSYTVTLIVTTGIPDFCVDTFQLVIEVQKPSILVIPNVFTPNNDGHNDEFIMESREIRTFAATIFNRWGKKIFEWTDVSKGWDGKTNSGNDAADGVYYFIIKAVGNDDVEYDLTGTITLIR